MLGAVGGVQQGLGPVRQPGRRHVEQDRAQPLADRGRSRLAGHDDLVALGPDPVGERLDLGGLAGPVAALQGEEESVRGGCDGRVPATAQRLAQVTAQRDSGPVVRPGEDDHGDGQQQGADEHQDEGGPAVGEDEVPGTQPVPSDGGGEQRTAHRAEGDQYPYDGLEVLGGPGPPGLLGLLLDHRVPDVGGDPCRVTGEQRGQQPGRRVRDQAQREERHSGDGGGEGQQPAPRQGGKHLLRGTDTERGADGQGEDQQGEGGGSSAQVGRVEHGDRGSGGDGPGDRGTDADDQGKAAGTALVGARSGGRPAQPFQGRARSGRRDARKFEEVEDRDRGREEAGCDVRAQGRLVEGEPVEPGTEQAADQRGDQEHGRSGGDRQEVRPLGEPP
ncbi:hypothetical protein EES45_19100 [Streptomyces sp. ADI97-07]|nr:hypothetical protein EES45_19100 [Streptomyces sp. ADI97-07]